MEIKRVAILSKFKILKNMKTLIDAVIYTDIHNELGPDPIHWFPSDLP
ncbi:unnamed protein product, partial [marine sediment metagenome]